MLWRSKWRQREQLPGFERGRILGLIEADFSNRCIGYHLGRSDMEFAQFWQQWTTEGIIYRHGGSERPSYTNTYDDRAIIRATTSSPATLLESIRRHLPPSRHLVVSRETVWRLADAVIIKDNIIWVGKRPGHWFCPVLVLERYRSLSGITFQDGDRFNSCQVIYSQFGLTIHQNDHQARSRFIEWAQKEIAVVPDFHKRILFSDEAHFWLNGYVNKQNCRIWSEANPQVYVETPLHPEKLTIWCTLWAGGILLQKR
ncbi:uncharacterized protein TNCV_2099801 [Trichonephila clavipes]|nr:uncharacterized protein TNCV_2099801 [Trichonephila clavipes]